MGKGNESKCICTILIEHLQIHNDLKVAKKDTQRNKIHFV